MKTRRMFLSASSFRQTLAVSVMLAALVLAMTASYPPAAHAATVRTVTQCSDGTGAGTLREAIAAANLSGGDTINFSFSVPCTISLGSSLPMIEKAMTINGPGESNLILDGMGLRRIVQLFCDADVCDINISGLTIQNGHDIAYGAGIDNEVANLTLSHVTFKNTTTGGALSCFSGSSATLNDVTFSNNTASVSGGAGLYGDSGCKLFLNNVRFDGNTNTTGPGAMATWNVATLNNVTFTNNSTTGSPGGAISTIGTLTITNSTFSNNSAAGHNGGAIDYENAGNKGSIYNSTFISNTSSLGGGIMVGSVGATLTMTNTSFTNNTATTSGGAVFSYGELAFTNVTFSGNHANAGYGGAVNNQNGVTIANATFDHNSSTLSGSAIINVVGGTTTIVNSTIADNSGAVAIGGYSGITLKNSIVSGNSAGNCYLYSGGVITDGGGNLNWASAGQNCPGISADPKLAALANNGGPVQTRALLAGSGAINAGNSSTCAAAVGSPTFGAGGVDARGLPRRNGVCEIGAFEAQPASLSVVSGSSPQSALINTAFSLPLKAHVTDANTNGLGGIVVTFAAPSSGPSAVLSATTATSNTNGNAAVTATANGIFGAPYNVTATASGLTPINFALTNMGLPQFLPLIKK